MGLVSDMHALKLLHSAILRLLWTDLLYPNWRKGQVIQNTQMWEQIELLKDHANLASDAFDGFQIIRQFNPHHSDLAFLMLL